MEMRSCWSSSGFGVDSAQGLLASGFVVIMFAGGKYQTLIAHDGDVAAMFCDAQGMVLHAWAMADVSQDDDLD
jgi:hypothetical protein